VSGDLCAWRKPVESDRRLTRPRPNPASEGFAFELVVEEAAGTDRAVDARAGGSKSCTRNAPRGMHAFGHEWERKQTGFPRALASRGGEGASGDESVGTRIVRVN